MTRTKWREIYSEDARLRYMLPDEEPDHAGCMGIAIALLITFLTAVIALLIYAIS